MTTEKFCTKCGRKFIATGREVICPVCREAAAEATKRAAVERAKRASWNGESVPVRISGRASTVIREYGAEHNLPFAQALDALLKASSFFQAAGKTWEDVEPYKSHRRSKSTAEDASQDKQDTPQASKPQDKAQDAQDVPQAAQTAKTTSKTSTSKNTSSKYSSKPSNSSSTKKG